MTKRHRSEAHRRLRMFIRETGTTIPELAKALEISPVLARTIVRDGLAPDDAIQEKIGRITAQHHSGPIRAVDWERAPI